MRIKNFLKDVERRSACFVTENIAYAIHKHTFYDISNLITHGFYVIGPNIISVIQEIID